MLGKLCFGPVLTLGLPNLLGVGLHARYGEHWGLGVDYQFFSTSDVDNIAARLSLITISGRYHPLANSFFVMAGFSYQSASLEASTTVVSGTMTQDVTIKGALRLPQVAFGLGFVGHDGFVLGVDLAVGIPLGSRDADIEVGLPANSPLRDDPHVVKAIRNINNATDTVVSLLPLTFNLNLIRVGYVF